MSKIKFNKTIPDMKFMFSSHATLSGTAPGKRLLTAMVCVFIMGGIMSCKGPDKTRDRDRDFIDTTDVAITFDRPVLDRTSEQVRSFQVEYSCSRQNPRTIVVNLGWNTDRKLVNRQRVDVTVYEDGFEKGYYVSMGMGAPDEGFLHARPDVKMKGQPYARTLALQTDSLHLRSEDGNVRLQFSKLNSQTNYFWRVLTLSEEGWIPSNIIRKSTPTCVYDKREKDEY